MLFFPAASAGLSTIGRRCCGWKTVVALFVVLLNSGYRATAQAVPKPSEEEIAFYVEKVQPIFERHCYKCHGPEEEAQSEFRISSRDALLAGGELGPVVDFDDPDDSQLLRALRYEDLEMPPAGRLGDREIEAVAQWVEMGAPFPAAVGEGGGSGAQSYWAYQKIERPEPPRVDDAAWITNPIDAFILARLEAADLKPASQADKQTLVRRIYYDLTGLPPTPEQVREFLVDPSPDAYARLVDRLLDSPHYGERWGRHWLDVVRFAETNGYERDNAKPSAWRYRDYVIGAFNDDKPFDRFVLEQLAGDELEDAGAETIVATGYYRLGLWDDEPVDADQAYYDSLDDVVSTTGQAFLGMTIGCARCHDHKIDPLPQSDYYSLLAFFNNTYKDIKQLEFEKTAFTLNTLVTIASFEQLVQRQIQERKLAAELEQVNAQVAEYEERIYAALTNPEKEDAQDEEVRRHLLEQRRGDVLAADELQLYLAALEHRHTLEKKKLPPLPQALAIKENGREAPPTHVLTRGSVHAPAEEVQPAFPAVLGFELPEIPEPAADAKSCGRRLELARWLVHPDNPLTARVLANRLWQHHFGRGIVRTPNDFGKFGERPTHPQLLDWLAAETIARGWRLKSMHRLIMLSSAYRMASVGDQEGYDADPRNDLFGRFDLRRLAAEEIRDSVLAASGALNLKVGGPSVFPPIPAEILAGASRPEAAWNLSAPEDQVRRSVYTFVKRSLPEPVLQTFDLADNGSSCAVRFNTTVPTQSLTMLNGEFFVREAERFARRLEEEVGHDPAAQVERALWLLLCRSATEGDIDRGVELIENLQREEALSAADALKYFCLMAFNLNEFVYVD